jgi:hypothetical protein
MKGAVDNVPLTVPSTVVATIVNGEQPVKRKRGRPKGSGKRQKEAAAAAMLMSQPPFDRAASASPPPYSSLAAASPAHGGSGGSDGGGGANKKHRSEFGGRLVVWDDGLQYRAKVIARAESKVLLSYQVCGTVRADVPAPRAHRARHVCSADALQSRQLCVCVCVCVCVCGGHRVPWLSRWRV